MKRWPVAGRVSSWRRVFAQPPPCQVMRNCLPSYETWWAFPGLKAALAVRCSARRASGLTDRLGCVMWFGLLLLRRISVICVTLSVCLWAAHIVDYFYERWRLTKTSSSLLPRSSCSSFTRKESDLKSNSTSCSKPHKYAPWKNKERSFANCYNRPFIHMYWHMQRMFSNRRHCR